jgi:hypothetical protein
MRQTNSAEKILYLDYDGVLHDDEVYFHRKRGIYIKTPGRVLFEWMPILEEILAAHPEVKIVLSTSWVRFRSFDFAKGKLSGVLRERVIGATYHKRFMRKEWFVTLPRGEQIAQDVLRRGPKAWFAIDDDFHQWPDWCWDNLIRTYGSVGISDPEVQFAIRTMLKRF